METPGWSEKLSVGHPVLDAHHRHLFELAHRAIALGAGTIDRDAVRALLDELIGYTAYHFDEEERLMALAGFPFLDLHRDSHRGIVLRLHDLSDSTADRPLAVVVVETAQFLAAWLVHHIEIEDFDYKPFIIATAFPPPG